MLKTNYFEPRRWYLAAHPDLPPSQTASPPLEFEAVEANPLSGNQGEEFIEIRNPHSTAVDLSGWRLTGGVEYTFAERTTLAPRARDLLLEFPIPPSGEELIA